jgi:hypothetical protein
MRASVGRLLPARIAAQMRNLARAAASEIGGSHCLQSTAIAFVDAGCQLVFAGLLAGESGLSQLPFKRPGNGVRRRQNPQNPANSCDIIATAGQFISDSIGIA